jgi:ATP/maltotriose-dependent transcriptional regulator MalT
MAFVGRGAELAALQAAFQDENVHTVLIGGDAGIGKSRLVGEFTTRVGSQPLVLTGRCLEFGNDGLPFAPFLTLLRGLLPELTATGPYPALARWFPELGPAVAEPDRILLFGEILTVLEQAAAARPLILILEDLHWADASSRELLAFLIASLSRPGPFLIGTHREPTGPLRHLVAEWSRLPGVRQIAPATLSRHEVGRQLAALTETEPDPATVARVYERSQGNPLFVEALSRSPETTPHGLQELLLAGLPPLPADTQYVLRVASVAGGTVEHTLLEQVAGVSSLNESLRQLISEHVLLASDSGYSFRHELIRQAVYSQLLPIERSRLHASIAETLRGQPDRLAELAAHAHAAGDYPQAAEAAWGAANSAAYSDAPSERLHLLEMVLELWEKAPVAPAKLEVLGQAVEACYACGSVERGLSLCNEALTLASDERTRAKLHFQRARLKNLGRTGGRDDLLAALSLLPAEPPTSLRGEVLAELAIASIFAADAVQGGQYAQSAIEIEQRLGDRSLAAHAWAYLALSTADEADFAKARAMADLKALPDVATWEAAALVGAGEYAKAIDVIQQGISAASKIYQYRKYGPVLVVKWAQALKALARWNEALQLIDEALSDVEPPPLLSRAALLICLGEIHLAQGNVAAAKAAAEEASHLLGDEPWVRPYRIKLRTLQVRLAADRDEALRTYQTALSKDDITTLPHEAWPLIAAAGPPEIPPLPVTNALDRAYAAMARGDWETAIVTWRALPQPYELAQALLASARELLSKGERDQAQALLQEVAAIAPEPLRQEAQQLAARGRLHLRDKPGAQPNPAMLGLTAREMDVLRLVAEGKSNRQIAADLFISGNTAGVHVSRILAKLGVATRTEAARKLFDVS